MILQVYGMLLARELPGITVPEVFLPQDIRLARDMIERAAFLGFAVSIAGSSWCLYNI